jgi:hypothetical protein
MLDTQGQERRARSPISLQIIPKDSKALQTAVWYQDNSLADVSTDRDVRLAVIDANGTAHALVFPCRRIGNSWVDAKSRRSVEVYPTHWQEWTAEAS